MARAVNQRVQEEFFGDKTPNKVSSGASIAPDVSVADTVVITLTANTTIAAPLNTSALQAGSENTLVLVQDATGSRTVTWNAAWRNAPTGSIASGGAANTRALLRFSWDGVAMQYTGGATAFA